MNNDIVKINRKYWNEMISMGIRYNIDPWKLVKICNSDDVLDLKNHPNFFEYPSTYRILFAFTVIDNTPIFKDSTVYSKTGDKYIVNRRVEASNILECHNSLGERMFLDISFVSTQQILKTITISSAERDFMEKQLRSILNSCDSIHHISTDEYKLSKSLLNKLE